MSRAEKRKKYIPRLLALVLVLFAPLTYIRVLFDAAELNRRDLNIGAEHLSTITTSNGDILHQGSCIDPEIFGNLIGDSLGYKDGSLPVENAIVPKYKEELKITGFNPLVGAASLKQRNTSDLRTTLLSVNAHEHIKSLFGSYNGVCCVYNYVTGEVYMLLSLPSGLKTGPDAVSGSLRNNNLRNCFIPGSTMKIVATICALDQGLDDYTTTCTGETTLPDGNVAKCHSIHGKVDLKRAIGGSCNCYMAELIQKLNINEARQSLEKLGFILHSDAENVETDGQPPLQGDLSRLTYTYSTTVFDSNGTFSDVWGLIGQGKSQITPLHMATIAGSVANGGCTAKPYLMERITAGSGKVLFQEKGGDMMELVDPETVELTRQYWQEAVADYYTNVDDAITLAKSGTAEQGNGTTNRMLMGAMEEYNTAFFILVEGLPSGDPLIYTIANNLVQYLPRVE